jgi:SAM-dependent methyltransferase
VESLTTCLGCKTPIAGGWLCGDCEAKARGPAYLPLSRVGPDGGYDADLFRVLERLEPRSFWFRARNRVILWALRAYFPHARDLIEIGCGTGFVLQAIRRDRPELELVGAELFPAGLAVARRRLPRVPLVQLDARDSGLADSFDVVALLDVLEHIREDGSALTGAARALRRGGGLLITVPQHPWLWSAADVFARHERRYRRADLVRKVEDAGLQAVRVTSFVTLLLPLLAASRLRGGRASSTYEFEREFSLPRFVDNSLERTVVAELALIARGVSLPAGGSLLVVAKKT